jgi:hypothetical protein
MKHRLLFFAFALTFFSHAHSAVRPNRSESQTQPQIQRELRKLGDWLGTWKLECKKGNLAVLRAENTNAGTVVKTTYGDAGNSIDRNARNDTSILQAQVADLITLIVSGPDTDEGVALVVLPGSFDQTRDTTRPGHPVSRTAQATVLVYNETYGATDSIDTLNCELN